MIKEFKPYIGNIGQELKLSAFYTGRKVNV